MNQTIKKQNSQGTITRLFSQIKGQHVRLTVVAVSIVIYIGLSIYNPMYSALVIDHLWQSIQAAWNDGTPFSITWTNMGRELTQLTVQYFFTWIFYYLQSYLMANVAENLNLELRTQIAHKLNRLPLRFFDQNKAGEILSHVTSDLDKIADVLQTGLLKLLVAIGTIIGSLAVMFYYSVSLTCIFLIFMVFSMVITQIVAKKNLQCAAERQETIGELTGIVEEYYNGRNVIKAYNHEKESLEQVTEAAEKNRAANQKADFLTNCVNSLIRLLTRLANVVIAIIAGKAMLSGTMTVGVVQAFFQYVNQTAEPLTEASFMINSLQSALASARRTFELLDEEEEIPDSSEPAVLKQAKGNIAYGRPDATREEIIAAAKAAKVDYFIRTMPNGYDTMLDNEAANLSAGQRQLITIARVFLCNPPVIILDEATSSVDTRTEAEIGKAMKKLMKGRTSFVIAHRLSTIRDADTILFMERGNIIEQGNHRELLAKKGAYASLYYSQFE